MYLIINLFTCQKKCHKKSNETIMILKSLQGMIKTIIALSPLKTNFIEMKNTKIILLALVMVLSASAYAQSSGTNTKAPKGALHVDSKKNNTATPTAAEEADDFIVTSTGNVGIGNTSPTVKLLIDNGTNGAAIKIVDGTQQVGRVLTSDVNGVGTWTNVPAFTATVLGTFTATSVNSNSGSGSYVYSGVSITLPIGKWAVNAGATFTNVSDDLWQHCYLSSSQTSVLQSGFTHLGPAGNNTSYAGILIKAAKAAGAGAGTNGTGFVTGSSVINVTTANTTIYLLLEGRTSNVFSYASNNFENFFYAVPVQ